MNFLNTRHSVKMYTGTCTYILFQLIAAPFAAGTLYFDPPGAYFFQIPTYIFGNYGYLSQIVFRNYLSFFLTHSDKF